MTATFSIPLTQERRTRDEYDLGMAFFRKKQWRIAARHLRHLGYRREFPKSDESITTNVGHIWSGEVEWGNFKWENPLFCGADEA